MTEEEMRILHNKIDAGVKAAIAEAIERHRQLGQSISIMQDEKVITLTAEEIATIQLSQRLENKG